MPPDFPIVAFKERANQTSIAGSGTIRAAVSGTFNPEGEVLRLSGFASLPYTYQQLPLGNSKVSVGVPGAVSLRVLGGGVIEVDFLGPTTILAEGTISLRSHRVTALNPAE
jgi:hypothetical protein